jgi:hypothetical protein
MALAHQLITAELKLDSGAFIDEIDWVICKADDPTGYRHAALASWLYQKPAGR